MIEQELHEMYLAATHPSGAQEWACPACGRRVVMHHHPTLKRVVLESGDQLARHSGTVGGLQIEAGIHATNALHPAADLAAIPELGLPDTDAAEEIGPYAGESADLLDPWARAIDAIERKNLEDLQ